jgi:hypothetical protein
MMKRRKESYQADQKKKKKVNKVMKIMMMIILKICVTQRVNPSVNMYRIIMLLLILDLSRSPRY